MYQIQKPEKYYIYNCKKQAYVFIADNWNELIAHIAQFNYHPWYSDKKMCNRFLENFNCTMNDTRVYCDWTNEYSDLREYTVFDDDFRIIDMRLYEKEILAYKSPESLRHRYKNKALEYKYEKTKPEFRCGPVPRTGKGWRRYGSLRHPHTLNEMRQNCEPEHQQYVRKRRRNLPTAWDDIFRGTSHCWKDQSKKRRQWM